jgi:hypothetical protein
MSPQASNSSSDGRSQLISVYAARAAIALSLFATVIVVGNVVAGVPPQPDENAWAHLYQLAMAAQVPLLLLFIATADWKRPRPALILLIAQLCVAAAAFAALWWSGY